MKDFHNLVESIFYSILKLKNFKPLEKNKNSILFFNSKCYLFIGHYHYMGETYVHISKDKKKSIQPLMWAIVNKKINFTEILPLNFSPKTKMEDLVKYNLTTEKTLISLYCKELLDGDFSNLEFYTLEFEKKNEELYNFYKREF